MKAMEKIKLSKERVNLIADLKSGNLKGLAKIKASKRVVEIVVLLGGDGAGTPAETTDMLGFDDRDYAFLTGVINGDYSNAVGDTLKALIQRGDSITLELSKRKGGVSPNANQLVQDAMLVLLGMSSEPTTNPLYQSVLDGAEVTIELVKQVRAEGQKDPDHPQLRAAVRVIVEAVKAMAA